jgi:hypothetical protein
MRLPQGAGFRGCSHSFTFRLLHSLDLQVAPTAEHKILRAARPFTPRIAREGYPFQDVASLRVRHGQLTRRDFHPLDYSLVGCSFPRPAPRTGRADCPHPALFQILRPSRSACLHDGGVSDTTSAFGRDRPAGIVCTLCRNAVPVASATCVDAPRCTAGAPDRSGAHGRG